MDDQKTRLQFFLTIVLINCYWLMNKEGSCSWHMKLAFVTDQVVHTYIHRRASLYYWQEGSN